MIISCDLVIYDNLNTRRHYIGDFIKVNNAISPTL